MLRSARLRRPPGPECAPKDTPPGDRTTRVLPARLPDELPVRHCHSSRDPAPGLRIERTHLDGTVRGSGAARSPLERGVKRGQLQDGESSQLLLSVGIWTVLHAPLSLLNSYGGSRFRHLQRIAPNKDARFHKSLVVGAPGAGVRVGGIVFPCGESLRRFVDQQCKLHPRSPHGQFCISSEGMTCGKPAFRQAVRSPHDSREHFNWVGWPESAARPHLFLMAESSDSYAQPSRLIPQA